MTTWVENPRNGRDRGPRGLARAWVEVLIRPRRFFRNGVAPGDQAPGLVFGVLVALCFVGGMLAFSSGTVLGTELVPLVADSRAATSLLVLLVVALFVAPATLHLTAALQTVLLVLTVRDRAGVSETVQTIAYATAPCVLAGVPIPELRVVCALYGAGLLAIGISEIHRTSLLRAALVSAIPSVLVFGYAFRGLAPLVALVEELLRSWTLI
ncbi:YIP1 family protein [Haloprofundus salinisoli]|uniref:YIP1 family protein n=1 Tax=Haloprofundus salinisoli TaxID=2876193 RepID=UPI001CCA906F|nr:YIP1 family protein [Haloprofundus salinisoli]